MAVSVATAFGDGERLLLPCCGEWTAAGEAGPSTSGWVSAASMEVSGPASALVLWESSWADGRGSGDMASEDASGD